MIPIYLMFADAAEALAALTKDEAPIWPPEAPIWPPEALQWVPVPVTRATGEVDAEGLEIFETVAGYHVNALWDGVTEIYDLTPYRTYPETPSVVWAGISES